LDGLRVQLLEADGVFGVLASDVVHAPNIPNRLGSVNPKGNRPKSASYLAAWVRRSLLPDWPERA
jgi:hypothetical protein